MKEYAEAVESFENMYTPEEEENLYYSVEIPVSELAMTYQFKLWRMESVPMFITVREDSDLLPWLRAGNRVKMKYYSTDPICPQVHLVSRIGKIKKQEAGRLRGLYIVDLEIVERNGLERDPWSYPRKTRDASYNALLQHV